MRFHRAALAFTLAMSLLACGGSDNASSPAVDSSSDTGTDTSDGPTSDAGDAIDGLILTEVGAVNHTEEPVAYPTSPPVGGDHHPGWQNCGSYAEPIPNEQAVHSLEHGAVWITYDPALAEADVAALRALTKNQTHILVSPYPGLTSPVAASAWGVQVLLDGVGDERLKAFVETYQQGPQTPEPGATCSGALGTPL